ncbi:aquaporin-11 [Perognathus longimembris pacificus]|uniref:aquaporin-11 n=1 Tax=Perognathus longimembris pacificus TaxID=214514 RepID=UPI0020189DAE|nr:aquaporin-11 [Perognathus longimembris pacificus]
MAALLQGLWAEARGPAASLALLLAAVLLAGLARAAAGRLRPRARALALELLGTWQLCCCTHELQLLSAPEPARPSWAPALLYLLALVHGLTLAGAAANPCVLLLQLLRGGLGPGAGALRLAAQLAGALGSRLCVSAAWGLGPSEPHLAARALPCRGPLRAALPQAVATEAACAFLFHSALLHSQEVRGPLRLHLLAALTTFLAHAGGSLTGALYNPALALSLHLKCFVEDFHQFFVVYCLGPSLGILLMVLMFNFFLPWLHNNSTANKNE